MNTDELDRKSQEITLLVMPHVTPLFFLPNAHARPDDVSNNGSAALVNTGERKLLITCHHVLKGFYLYREEHPDAIIAMGMGNTKQCINVTSFPVVDSDSSIDIAILEFSRPDLLDGTEKKFTTTASWPPKRPKQNDVIVAVGWPGINRRPTSDHRDLSFLSTTIIDWVASVSDRHLVLADSNNQRTVRTYQDGVLVEGSHGGMSGCPAFVNRNETFEFIGIVYEASEGVGATFFITHASHIKPDGTIDQLVLPPK